MDKHIVPANTDRYQQENQLLSGFVDCSGINAKNEAEISSRERCWNGNPTIADDYWNWQLKPESVMFNSGDGAGSLTMWQTSLAVPSDGNN